MRRLATFHNSETVFVPGEEPCLIMKENSSSPVFVRIYAKAVADLALPAASQPDLPSFLMIDSQVSLPPVVNAFTEQRTSQNKLKFAQLPRSISYGHHGWISQSASLDYEVDASCYYAATDHLVLATSWPVEFALPEDDYHHEWAQEGMTPQGII